MSGVRPRLDQALFHAFLDEDGARAIVRGEIPDYVRQQCADFLVGVDEGIAAMVALMRVRAQEAEALEPRPTPRQRQAAERRRTGDKA